MAVTRFWVGGTGTFDATTTTHWSATTGGAGGASVPTTTDTATFDGNSGGGTVTTSGAQSVTAITFAAGFTGTLTLAAGLTVSGAVTLLQGTLNTNGQTCSWGSYICSGTAAKTLTMGASAITVTAAGSAWGVAGTTTSYTITANTATITFSAAAGLLSIGLGNFNYGGVTVVVSATGIVSWASGSSNVTFTYTPAAGSANNLQFGSSATFNAFTVGLGGGSNATRPLISSNVLGTQMTITVNGTVSINWADFQDIKGAGTGSWNLSAITGGSGDAGGNATITFTAPASQFWVGGTGNWVTTTTNWASSSGGAAGSGRMPLPQDSAVFDANSFTAASQTVTLSSGTGRLAASMTWAAVTNLPTFSYSIVVTIYGSLTWPATTALTISGTHSWQFFGRSGTNTITSGTGQGAWCFAATFNCPGATYVLAGNFSTANGAGSSIVLIQGTLDNSVNNVTITASAFTSTGTNTRAFKMGSGLFIIASSSGVVWNTTSTGFTLTVGTALLQNTAAASCSITTGGVSMPQINQNAVSNTLLFNDAFTTTGIVTLQGGTIDTGSQTCSWGSFMSAAVSTVRALTLGSSVITLTGVGGAPWNVNNATNLTINAGTSTIQTAAANLSNAQYAFGSFTYFSIIIQADSHSTTSTAGSFTCTNFTYAPVVGTSPQGAFTINAAFKVTGALVWTGLSAPAVPIVKSATLGTPVVITANGTVTLTGRMDFEDVTGAGTATWNFATSGGDAGGNSGITFSTPQTNYYLAAANANWSVAANWFLATGGTGGAGRVPFPQDSCVLDANSGAHTYTVDCMRLGGTLTCTGFTGTFTQSVAWTCYGSLILSSGMTALFPDPPNIFSGRASFVITTAGKTFSALTFNAPGGTYVLTDNFLGTGAFTLTNGTIDNSVNNVNVTLTSFICTTTASPTLKMGSGIWTLSGTGVVWNLTSAGTTITAGTSTIVISDTSATSKTFAGNGKTYNNLQITGSSGGVIVTGANTFTSISETATGVLTLASSVTQTIAPGGSLTLNGVTLNSTTPGTAATISAPSGVTIAVSNVTLQDSTATGTAAPFLASGASVRVSNVTGWGFAYILTGTDSIALGDVALRTAGHFSAATDSLVLTDAAARATAVGIVALDVLSLGDAVTRALVQLRSAVDALLLADAAAESAARARQAVDLLALADAAVRSAQAFLRTGSDTLALLDAATDLRSFARTSIDGLLLADAAAAGGHRSRLGSDALALTDAATRVLVLNRVAADACALVDLASAATRRTRTGTDALVLLDAATDRSARVRSSVDSLLLADQGKTVLHASRSGADRLVLLDAAAAGSSRRQGADLLVLLDTTAPLFVLTGADQLQLIDLATAYFRAGARTWEFSELVPRWRFGRLVTPAMPGGAD